MKSGVFTSLIMALSMAMLLQAEPVQKPSQSGSSCLEEDKTSDRFDESLNELEQSLKLSPQQMSLWKDWSTRLRAAHAIKLEGKKNEHGWRHLAAPVRQEKWMESAQNHLKAMQDSLPSLKLLYESLSDEQRKLFDREVPFKHRDKATHQ